VLSRPSSPDTYNDRQLLQLADEADDGECVRCMVLAVGWCRHKGSVLVPYDGRVHVCRMVAPEVLVVTWHMPALSKSSLLLLPVHVGRESD